MQAKMLNFRAAGQSHRSEPGNSFANVLGRRACAPSCGMFAQEIPGSSLRSPRCKSGEAVGAARWGPGVEAGFYPEGPRTPLRGSAAYRVRRRCWSRGSSTWRARWHCWPRGSRDLAGALALLVEGLRGVPNTVALPVACLIVRLVWQGKGQPSSSALEPCDLECSYYSVRLRIEGRS